MGADVGGEAAREKPRKEKIGQKVRVDEGGPKRKGALMFYYSRRLFITHLYKFT